MLDSNNQETVSNEEESAILNTNFQLISHQEADRRWENLPTVPEFAIIFQMYLIKMHRTQFYLFVTRMDHYQ